MEEYEFMKGEVEKNKIKNTCSVSYPDQIAEYLTKHPEINKSEVFQNAMNKIINPRKNPLLLVIGVLGVCFSVMCLAISLSGILLLFGKEGFILSTIFFCVGCAILTASILIYYKDKNRK